MLDIKNIPWSLMVEKYKYSLYKSVGISQSSKVKVYLQASGRNE